MMLVYTRRTPPNRALHGGACLILFPAIMSTGKPVLWANSGRIDFAERPSLAER